jgi:uncharacterized protein
MSFVTKLIAALVYGAIYLLTSVTFAASFDCQKATTTNEHLICKDSELSKLDDELAVVYKQAKNAAQNQEQFKSENKAAWQDREKRCTDKACLVDWYQSRQLKLSQTTSETTNSARASESLVNTSISDASVQTKNREAPVVQPGKTENPSYWSAAFWTGLGVALLVFFKKSFTFYKRWRAKKALDEIYKNNNSVGIFLSDLVYVQAHQKINSIKNLSVSVLLYKLNLPIIKCSTIIEKALWTADVGVLNQSAYANAMHRHETALNKYENDRKQFHVRESAKHRINNSYVPASWNGTAPSAPSKGDFVDYRSENGETVAYVEHSWKVATKASSIANQSGQTIISPIDVEKQFAILNIYENIIINHLKKDIIKTNNSFDLNIDDNYIFETESKAINNAILKSTKSDLGEFYKNFSIQNVKTKLKIEDLRYLPLVVSKSNSNTIEKITIHDHLEPNIVIQ